MDAVAACVQPVGSGVFAPPAPGCAWHMAACPGPLREHACTRAGGDPTPTVAGIDARAASIKIAIAALPREPCDAIENSYLEDIRDDAPAYG